MNTITRIKPTAVCRAVQGAALKLCQVSEGRLECLNGRVRRETRQARASAACTPIVCTRSAAGGIRPAVVQRRPRGDARQPPARRMTACHSRRQRSAANARRRSSAYFVTHRMRRCYSTRRRPVLHHVCRLRSHTAAAGRSAHAAAGPGSLLLLLFLRRGARRRGRSRCSGAQVGLWACRQRVAAWQGPVPARRRRPGRTIIPSQVQPIRRPPRHPSTHHQSPRPPTHNHKRPQTLTCAAFENLPLAASSRGSNTT